MNGDPLASLYRKPCPSCARDLPRDARRCEYCGYTEPGVGDGEEDQERLYGEYLSARLKQAREAAERLRCEWDQYPDDRGRERQWHAARTELQIAERQWRAYEEAQQPVSAQPVPPPPVAVETVPVHAAAATVDILTEHTDRRIAAGDKVCPACQATMPSAIGRCACGHVFGEAVATTVCPHCTAVVDRGAVRCACGYPLSVGPVLPSAVSARRARGGHYLK